MAMLLQDVQSYGIMFETQVRAALQYYNRCQGNTDEESLILNSIMKMADFLVVAPYSTVEI
jgi:hypothetical protein